MATRAWRVLAGALLLGVAACGTTVPGAEGVARQELRDAQGLGPAGTPLQTPAVGATSGPGTAVDVTPTDDPGAGGATGVGSTGALPPPGGKVAGPATPVEVGFEYATGVTEFAAALGISADVGDGRQQAQAIVDWVNAHGGLAGHRIKPVFYALDLTRSDPYSQFMDEMCSLWTEDHHVVAAFAYANADFTPVAQCLTKHNAVFSSYASYSRNRADFARSPNWVETSTLSSERLAELQVRTFSAQGFLKGQSKVGLLAYDYDQAETLTSALVARLKQLGVTTVVYRIRYGSSTPELGATIGSIQNAVLRFRTEGIERVMSAAYPGAMAFFMRYADSQSYRPLYGLTSYDGLGTLPANAPVSQLHGAIATGWWPTADLVGADRPPLNASGRICRAVFSKAGIPTSQDAASFGYCDEVLALQAAARLVTAPTLTGDALRAAFEGLGSSYTSPSMLGTRFAAGRRDGISHARPLAFNDACTCWRSAGAISAIP